MAVGLSPFFWENSRLIFSICKSSFALLSGSRIRRAFSERALRIDCRIHLYEGTEHGFNNDTGARYHKEAAALAWKRTVDFFREKL